MTAASIIIRTSAQTIEQADIRQLRDAILASARADLGAILDHVKTPNKPAPTGARARAVVQAVQALPARARDGLLASRAGLSGAPVAIPRRTTPFANLRGLRPAAAAAAAPASKLSLRAQKIECVSDTREAGKDEMLLGAQATVIALSADGTGTPADAGTTAPIALGKFKSGDKRALDITLCDYDLRDPAPFPRVFNAVLLLVEHDFGDPGKLLAVLRTLEALIEDKVVEKVQEFLDDAIKDEKLDVLVTLAVTLVPSILAGLISAAGKLFGDEAFPPFITTIAMDSASSRFDGGKQDTADQVAVFSAFGGTYKLTFDFALT